MHEIKKISYENAFISVGKYKWPRSCPKYYDTKGAQTREQSSWEFRGLSASLLALVCEAGVKTEGKKMRDANKAIIIWMQNPRLRFYPQHNDVVGTIL